MWYVSKWADIYLEDAHARLASQLKGYDLSIEDVYTMQQMCAYEVGGNLGDGVVLSTDHICRLWRSDTPSSVNCSLKTTGKVSITREFLVGR